MAKKKEKVETEDTEQEDTSKITKGKKKTSSKEEVDTKSSKLDLAKKTIKKKYGNIIGAMGDEKELFIPTISTGSLGLDLALGRGGLARGRIYEFYGPPSGGKCLTKDTYLSTEHGLLTIEELFELYKDPVVTANKEKEYKCGLKNEHGDLEKTSHFVWSGKRPVKKITTDAGFETKSTQKHRYRVIDPNTGFVIWKRTSEIKEGDYVLINTKKCDFVKYDDLNEEEAMFLGMLVAEGSLGYRNKLGFTNSDKDIVKLFIDVVDKVDSSVDVKNYSKDIEGVVEDIDDVDGVIESHINSKTFREMLHKKYDLDYVNAAEKTVPLCIRRGTTTIISKFLSAYFSLDGCYENDGSITACSASKKLLTQIQLLLLNNFGIKSTVNFKYNTKYDKNYYYIYIGDEDVLEFLENVGFILNNKNEKVSNLNIQYNLDNRKTMRWNFPYQNNLIRALCKDAEGNRGSDDIVGKHVSLDRNDKLSHYKLHKIIDCFEKIEHGYTSELILDHFRNLKNYVCDRVYLVEDFGEEPVFDVVMPKTHSFFSNGLISHNTTLSMSVMAEAQKRGFTTCFCDAEHTADPQLFKAMGVNIDDVIKVQAYAGEDNLDALETLIKTGTIDVAVIDSVSALIPKTESEAAIDDDFIGLLARLMSKTMRRFVPIASETNTLVIFINQLRNKIGQWGDPTTTTGGEALNFYATGRISVSGGEFKKSRIMDKISGEVLGHITTFDIQKNKLAPPYRKAHVRLIYGVGYDIHRETLDLAEGLAIVEKNGAHYYYEGERFAQGEENAVDYLKENDEFYKKLREQIINNTGLKELYERNS